VHISRLIGLHIRANLDSAAFLGLLRSYHLSLSSKRQYLSKIIMRATASLHGRTRKLPITTKNVGNGFYKGTGSGAMGRHTKHGDYRIDVKKVRTYVVPEQLKDCKVWKNNPSPRTGVLMG